MNDERQKGRSNKWLIALVILGGIMLLICGGPITWYLVRQSRAASQVEQRRQEIIDRGLPIDDDSMESYRYQLMGHRNSERWMAILDRLDSPVFQSAAANMPVLGRPVDETPFEPGKPYPLDDEVSEFLSDWRPLLNEMHDVLEGSGSIWTEIEFDSFNTELQYSQTTRAAVRLLTLEFEDAVRRQDREQTFHALMALIGAARSLEDEPVLISQLVHIACAGIALNKIKTATELNLLDRDQWLAVLDQLRQMDQYHARYQLAVVGERAMSQPIFDDLGRLSDQDIELPRGFRKRSIDALISLEYYEKIESLPEDDLTLFLQRIEEIDQEFVDQIEKAGFMSRFETMVTALLTPSFRALGRAVVRNTMSIRIAKLGIAVRLFEIENGRMPETLEELLAADLGAEIGETHPVGESPIGYRIVNSQARLWGFDPQTSRNATPIEPPEGISEDQSEAFWDWRLPPADAGSKQQ